jgi:drug/metabolite transporter (DMT)-like permease
MGLGIAYAVISLGFAGINDVVFKKYGMKTRPVGLLLAFIGVVWTLFFVTLAALKHAIELDGTTFLVGSVSGILSALANILLIEGMKRTRASVASTIYRLNLVFVALLAFVFLHETMGFLKLAGLLVAIVAVITFSISENKEGSSDIALKFLLILLLASFLRACMGISYKIASSFGLNDEMFLAVNGFWWVIFGSGYTFFREKGICLKKSTVKYALYSGVLVCGIVLFLKLAVNHMDASVAVSVSQFSFLVTAPLAACFMKERITRNMSIGMCLAALCIILFYLAK